MTRALLVPLACALGPWALLLLALCVFGCVRTVTVCTTYDRALQRPDPNTFLQRDSAGASVCVEAGPR